MKNIDLVADQIAHSVTGISGDEHARGRLAARIAKAIRAEQARCLSIVERERRSEMADFHRVQAEIATEIKLEI